LLATSDQTNELSENIKHFQKKFEGFSGYKNSGTSVQSIVIPGNEKIQKISELLFEKGFDVRAVKSPTVKAGEERLRVSLHAFNNAGEINRLFVELSRIKDLSV
jgi:8-amino-7-oxononanoate synthase